jgi:acyl-coenzyme A thioesterase PaaI-like protein
VTKLATGGRSWTGTGRDTERTCASCRTNCWSRGLAGAGHDFAKGSRLTTISLSVQYLSVAPGEDLLAVGRCTRRGSSVHFAQAQVSGVASSKMVATGQVAVSISGERPGVPWRAAASR